MTATPKNVKLRRCSCRPAKVPQEPIDAIFRELGYAVEFTVKFKCKHGRDMHTTIKLGKVEVGG